MKTLLFFAAVFALAVIAGHQNLRANRAERELAAFAHAQTQIVQGWRNRVQALQAERDAKRELQRSCVAALEGCRGVCWVEPSRRGQQ